jgi:hypothetical protein
MLELKRTLQRLAFIADVNYWSKNINIIKKIKEVILVISQEAGLELNIKKALVFVYVSSTECRTKSTFKTATNSNHI